MIIPFERIASQETRARYWLLQLPDGENAGVLLLPGEPESNSEWFEVRLRRDWNYLVDSGQISDDEAEILELLENDLWGKAREMGGARLIAWLEDTLSNSLLISEPAEIASALPPDRLCQKLYRQHVRATVDAFRTHVPIYPLRAAAGGFSEEQFGDDRVAGWIELPPSRRADQKLFAARVEGRSMEPEIPDGSLCLFRGPVTGSRQGRKVLVEDLTESESSGMRFTVKRYSSKKETTEEGWSHDVVRMIPLNPEFEDWELQKDRQYRVLAEFLEVLE